MHRDDDDDALPNRDSSPTSNVPSSIANFIPVTYHFIACLTPVTGSIPAEPLYLYDRVSSWGRFPGGTHIWPDQKDTRIPRAGFDIIFWNPKVVAAEHRLVLFLYYRRTEAQVRLY